MRTSDIPLDLGDFVIAYATAKNRFDLLMERPSDASIEDCASLGVREIRRLRNAEHLPRGIRKRKAGSWRLGYLFSSPQMGLGE